MATQLQLRRGTAAENAVFTGAQGELTMSTDTKALQIHDGSTTGGFMVDTVVAFQKPTAGNDYTWVRKYASGWVEQGGKTSVTGYGDTSNATITLPVEMADTNFFGQATILGSGENIGLGQEIAIISATQISLRINYGSTVTRTICWEVKGMAA